MAAAAHPQLDELRRVRRSLAHARRRNVLAEFDRSATFGQRAADAFAGVVGSWRFIIIQSCILGVWIVLNVTALVRHWDPYPFILLNLALSFQAAYAGPIIMMSQNRAAALDRLQTQADHEVNQKSEAEIEELLTLLQRNTELLDEVRGAVTNR
jgi:uncharacterized membrane protein